MSSRPSSRPRRRTKERRQADAQRRKAQLAQLKQHNDLQVKRVFDAANDYMLDKYSAAKVDERWVPPRSADESYSAYYSRRGKHQGEIERLDAPLRARREAGWTLSEPKPFVQPVSPASSESDEEVVVTLQQAAGDGDAEMVGELLARGVDVDGKEGDVAEETALHVAAAKGNLPIVETLLRAGAAVGDADLQGQTPLHGAAMGGHEAVARALLMRGARLNAVDNEGNTPLHSAAKYGRTDVVRLLLHGAGRSRSGSRGRGATGLASHETQWALNHRNRHGRQPVDLATLADDGGEAVAAVLAEVTAKQTAAKATSELRAADAAGESLRTQLEAREEECAELRERLVSQEDGALAVQKQLAAARAKTAAAVAAQQQAEAAQRKAELLSQGLREDLEQSRKERRAATAALAAAAAARSSEAETGRLSQAEAELSQLRTSVRTMVRTHVARMLSTCPVSQRHCPPIFSATFRPFCAVFSPFFCGARLPGAKTE